MRYVWALMLAVWLFGCGTTQQASPPVEEELASKYPVVEQLMAMPAASTGANLLFVGRVSELVAAYDQDNPDYVVLVDHSNPYYRHVTYYDGLTDSYKYFSSRLSNFREFVDDYPACATNNPPWCDTSPKMLGYVGLVAEMLNSTMVDEVSRVSMGWDSTTRTYMRNGEEWEMFTSVQLEGPRIHNVEVR